jgi:hypothetical protein
LITNYQPAQKRSSESWAFFALLDSIGRTVSFIIAKETL